MATVSRLSVLAPYFHPNGQIKVMIFGRGNAIFNNCASDDVMNGGEGRDRAFRGSSEDVLNGSLGNEFLEGRAIQLLAVPD